MAHVVVCVTGQKTCEKLIIEGSKLAPELNAELSVLHVAHKGLNFMDNPSEGEALEYLYQISSQYGADMTMMRADNVVDALIKVARRLEVDHLVMGTPGNRGGHDLTMELGLRMPDVQIHVVYTRG